MNEQKIKSVLDSAREAYSPTDKNKENVHRSLVAALGVPPLDFDGSPDVTRGAEVNSLSLVSKSFLLIVGAGIVGLIGVWLNSNSEQAETKFSVTKKEPFTQVVTTTEIEKNIVSKNSHSVLPKPKDIETKLLNKNITQPVKDTIKPTLNTKEPLKQFKDTQPKKTEESIQNLNTSQSVKNVKTKNITKPSTSLGVADEISLMKRAFALQQKGNAYGAMKLLKEHKANFLNGILSLEREGLRVVVLCDLGKHVASENARKQFLQKNPNAPVSARLQNECKSRGVKDE